jgi:hypothetical protein
LPLNDDSALAAILFRLAAADGPSEEGEIGRSMLASWLHGARPEAVSALVDAARRDPRLRRSLAAARYYSGLPDATCKLIDAVLKAPFAAAEGKPKRHRR